jgi:hypothetical protein
MGYPKNQNIATRHILWSQNLERKEGKTWKFHKKNTVYYYFYKKMFDGLWSPYPRGYLDGLKKI